MNRLTIRPPRTVATVATCAFVAMAASVPAAAAPIAYLSGASTQTSSSATLPTIPLLPGATGFERTFVEGFSATSVQVNDLEFAQASASLETGALRVSTAFSGTGAVGAQTSASAFIGDGFAFSGPGGQPFSWNGETVTFNLDVSGTQAANIPAQVGTQQPFFDFSLVALMIYQPGTLQDSPVPFCNGGSTTNVIASFFWSIGQNASPPCGEFQGNFSGTVSQTVSATFAPTGDFAWALGLRAINASVGDLSGGIFWSYDFFNTLRYSFVAPPEVTVTTRSGIPPGGLATVPTPATWALLGLGLVGIAASRRRRS